MDEDARLRIEYDAATQLVRTLADTRLKLLALVPTVAGAVVALIPAHSTSVELVSISVLGLVATAGVLAFELQNGAVASDVGERAARIEDSLLPGRRLVRARGASAFRLPVSHALGVALVYGAALSGWVYLLSWGVLRGIGVHGGSRGIGVAIGAFVGVVAALAIYGAESAGAGDAE